MTVDAHHHVWDLTVRDQPWLASSNLRSLQRNFLITDLQPLAAAEGVTATVVVQTVTHPAETPELLALAAGSDLVAAAVGWVDLEDPAVTDALAALRGRPDGGFLRGIRHPVLGEPDTEWLRRPQVLRGLAAVAAAGLCYDVVARPEQLPAAAAAAAALPGLTFVLDHLGNPGRPGDGRPGDDWAGAVRALAALPNTVCKLSGILARPRVAGLVPYYDTVLQAFGPRRLMFGSDWPVCTASAPYPTVMAAARTLTAALSPAERREVFAGTAGRVYGLAGVRPEVG